MLKPFSLGIGKLLNKACAECQKKTKEEVVVRKAFDVAKERRCRGRDDREPYDGISLPYCTTLMTCRLNIRRI